MKKLSPKLLRSSYCERARILRIYEGPTQILQLEIAKYMLREFASEGAVW